MRSTDVGTISHINRAVVSSHRRDDTDYRDRWHLGDTERHNPFAMVRSAREGHAEISRSDSEDYATPPQRSPVRRREAVPHHPHVRALRGHGGAHHQGVPAAGEDGRRLRHHDGLRGRRPHRRGEAARRDGGAHAKQRTEQVRHGRRSHPRLHERALEAGRRHHRARRRRSRGLHHRAEDCESRGTGGDDRVHSATPPPVPASSARSRSTRSSRRTARCTRSGRSQSYRTCRCSISG